MAGLSILLLYLFLSNAFRFLATPLLS